MSLNYKKNNQNHNTNPIILDNINLTKYFSNNNIKLSEKNNSKLKITNVGLYSISKPYDTKWITQTIIDMLKINNIDCSNISIIDATAGIGGDTISFSKHFKNVIAVEMNKVHCDIIKNNIKALSINNVLLYCDNFLNILDKLKRKSNILFFDPPWGGQNYKLYEKLNLKIGDIELYEAINRLFNKKFKYVILKAPYNTNLTTLRKKVLYDNIVVYNLKNKNIILIFFY